MIGLLIRLLFFAVRSAESSYNDRRRSRRDDRDDDDDYDRRPSRRERDDDVQQAPVFSVLRKAEKLEQDGDSDRAVAILEDFMARTTSQMSRDMCRKRIDRIHAARSSSAQAADFLRAASEAEPERRAEASVLRACRERFSPAPRDFGQGDRLALDPDLERALVNSDDKLLRILGDQDALLARGQVVWGQLVQANQILFNRDNRSTCPANVIYSTDPYFDGRLALLESMARNLFAQKGSTAGDREMQEFVDAVTDEMARVLRREMPHSYTGGRSVCFATCFIQPAHLPHGYLCRSSFPIIVNPEETPALMLLPARFWPPELVAHWRE